MENSPLCSSSQRVPPKPLGQRQRQRHDDDADDDRGRDGARTALAEELCQRAGDLGHDADEDDQRDTVADAAGGESAIRNPRSQGFRIR